MAAMNVTDLITLGLPAEAIAVWQAAGIMELTAIQEKALTSDELLAGRNALVISPTSSGKTFIGEVLAVRSALARKRVLYVVPYKALAEEKYEYFREVFGSLGVAVAVSSGDRDEFDEDILEGKYFITVVVNEKLSQLLVQSPAMTADCDLVVFDEVQLIREEGRGAQVEMLLTRLSISPKPPQILALSGTAGALNGFDTWLNAVKIEDDSRPVALDESVIHSDGSVYAYDGYARTLSRSHRLSADTKQECILAMTTELVQADKQVLIFRATVDSSRELAEEIGKRLPRTSLSTQSLDALGAMEDSEARNFLTQYLPNGVVYHNAGLSFEERRFVESVFRDGSARVLVSTTTLAMGVNLPADAVIVADYMRFDARVGGARSIEVAEYKNCAGRAGRLGQSNHGAAYLVTEEEPINVARHFLGGSPEAIESAIPKGKLVEHILASTVGNLTSTAAEIRDLLEASFAAATFYKNQGTSLRDGISSSLTQLESLDLITHEHASGRIAPTALGTAVARTGISVDTAAEIIQFLKHVGGTFQLPDLVFELCHSGELGVRPYLFQAERRNTLSVRERCAEVVGDDATSGTHLKHVLTMDMLPNEIDATSLKRTTLALRWHRGDSIGDLRSYRIGLGYIRGLGENLAWLLEAANQIAQALNVQGGSVQMLGRWRDEMHYGVPEEAVKFARLRVPRLTRDSMIGLVRNNTKAYVTFDEVLDATPADVAGILGPTLLLPLQEAILNSTKETLHRKEAQMLVRARQHSLSEGFIKDLFESQGHDFERAIEDVLSAAPINLSATRIARQGGGEMDIHVSLAGGGCVVISATSSTDNSKPISWDKSREVLGAVGVQAPIKNFVVVGKPDFHSLAKRNADSISQEPREILLLPIETLAEVCMLAFEGKLDPSKVLEVLEAGRGYFPVSRLPELLP